MSANDPKRTLAGPNKPLPECYNLALSIQRQRNAAVRTGKDDHRVRFG